MRPEVCAARAHRCRARYRSHCRRAILERSIVAPGLLAQILVAKYCDHLPLYRQEPIYRTRHQVWLPRQTMAQWMGLAADWLRPIYEQSVPEVHRQRLRADR